jgi:hypothetical protein
LTHTTYRPGLGLVAAVAVLMVAGACGDDGGTDLDTPAAPDSTAAADTAAAAAAEAAAAAIAEGDGLGDCPFGSPAELAEALPSDANLGDGFGDDIDDGQVFSGGDVDIVYCEVNDFEAGVDEVSELRIDVSPGDDIDVDTYLDEEFTDPDDVSVQDGEDFAGGTTRQACWESFTTEQACGVFWQGDGVFVSVVAMGEDGVDLDEVIPTAEALVPVVLDRLAGSES